MAQVESQKYQTKNLLADPTLKENAAILQINIDKKQSSKCSSVPIETKTN